MFACHWPLVKPNTCLASWNWPEMFWLQGVCRVTILGAHKKDWASTIKPGTGWCNPGHLESFPEYFVTPRWTGTRRKGFCLEGHKEGEITSFVQEEGISRRTLEQSINSQVFRQLVLCWTPHGTLYLQYCFMWMGRRSGVEETNEFLFQLSLMAYTHCFLWPQPPFFILQRAVSIPKTLTLHYIVKQFLPFATCLLVSWFHFCDI